MSAENGTEDRTVPACSSLRALRGFARDRIGGLDPTKAGLTRSREEREGSAPFIPVATSASEWGKVPPHSPTLRIADLAADFKARFRLSLADAFAAALAKSRKAELVTGDPEFAALEGEIKIRWLTGE